MNRRRALASLVAGVVLPGVVLAGVVLAGVVLAGVVGPARAQTVFAIDQRYATIGFSVDHLGLFTSHGDFRRFAGTLTVDPAQPQHTAIAVDIDAQSVELDSAQGEQMVRSPDYFDVSAHPVIAFHSTGVTVTTPDHYRIAGLIEIRGITQPMTLDAVLTGHPGKPGEPEAEFAVSGSIQRAAFGMVADQSFVSPTVQVQIKARIALDHPLPSADGAGKG